MRLNAPVCHLLFLYISYKGKRKKCSSIPQQNKMLHKSRVFARPLILLHRKLNIGTQYQHAKFHINFKQFYPEKSFMGFYNFSARNILDKWIHLQDLEGKVTLVAMCDTTVPEYESFLHELNELKEKMAGKPFEVLVIPRYAKKAAEPSTSPIKDFFSQSKVLVCKGIPSAHDSEKDEINESSAEFDAFNFLRHYKDGLSKTIVEEFEKFIIDKNGQVVHRSGNNTPLSDLTSTIEHYLEMTPETESKELEAKKNVRSAVNEKV